MRHGSSFNRYLFKSPEPVDGRHFIMSSNARISIGAVSRPLVVDRTLAVSTPRLASAWKGTGGLEQHENGPAALAREQWNRSPESAGKRTEPRRPPRLRGT